MRRENYATAGLTTRPRRLTCTVTIAVSNRSSPIPMRLTAGPSVSAAHPNQLLARDGGVLVPKRPDGPARSTPRQ